MPTANWKNTVIANASSSDMVTVDNNLYFPLAAVNPAHIRPSTHTSVCGWKGTATYYDVVVDGEVNKDAAWTYVTPKDAAKEIAGRVAFWKGVVVEQ